MSPPKNIVLVHGFWVTPRSWEHWIAHYEAKGYNVIAPAYPGFEVEVEALNEDDTPIVERPRAGDHRDLRERDQGAGLRADHHRPLGRRGVHAGAAGPRLRRGGGGDQLCPDRGRADRAAVAGQVHLAGAEEPRQPPQGRRFTFEQWNYAFTNGLPEDQAREPYERYHVPASGRILFDSVTANFIPGPQDTAVNYKNDDRAPLLFVSGSEDHIMPPSIQKSNLKHYKSDTVTEITEYEGPHLMIAADGWEKIADDVLDWAVEHAR